MKVNCEVVIAREELGGYVVVPRNEERSHGLILKKAACTTLEEALEIASKLMEEEK